jgi:hypothetical protein
LVAHAVTSIELSPEERLNVERLGLGLLSPLPGFLGAAQAREAHLQDGTPWRRPLRLLVERARIGAKDALQPGAILRLLVGGRLFAGLRLEAIEDEGTRLGLPGEVWVDQAQLSRPEAAERRAELLRHGRARVLAVQPGQTAPAGFDEVLPIDLPTGDPWLDAVIAQNMGATHVLCEAAAAQEIRESLAIAPVLAWG